ncbi:MAG: hypothetical protein JWM74_4461, partial [Myxococcaceae bacterium]|nr:hypothetical protein [Myxococcaceae bacterium]
MNTTTTTKSTTEGAASTKPVK